MRARICERWCFPETKFSKTALEIVPGATHLFEEPGTLEKVVKLVGDWFETYFKTQKSKL